MFLRRLGCWVSQLVNPPNPPLPIMAVTMATMATMESSDMAGGSLCGASMIANTN